MGREWVAFSETEKSYMVEEIISRFGTTFSGELVHRLIHILESSVLVEIDFGDLIDSLELCKKGDVVFENRKHLDLFLVQHQKKLKGMLVYREYNVSDPQLNPEGFSDYCKHLRMHMHKEGLFGFGCSVTLDEESEFFLVGLGDD
ncbi:hypothetical protein [Pseudoalteromonas pernae]|uniref:hypothetical protein n=1 Tax=Pseudoalteromonas pernae TaxID=3118054 RepID=UPI0032429A54